MRDLKHPAKPIIWSESDVEVAIHSDEESDAEEDYNTIHASMFVSSISYFRHQGNLHG